MFSFTLTYDAATGSSPFFYSLPLPASILALLGFSKPLATTMGFLSEFTIAEDTDAVPDILEIRQLLREQAGSTVVPNLQRDSGSVSFLHVLLLIPKCF